jgi:membrane-associated phospholipid phosphatase
MTPWQAVARLGEAQILLPALAAVCLWLAWRGGAPRTAAWALGLTALATAVTTVTKVAFIGYEVGYAPWDYTGVAGHSMFAAAAWPVLVGVALPPVAARWRVAALALAYALAAVISVSRIVTGAHSPSEVVLGFLLGAAASALALRLGPRPRTPVPAALLVALVAWMLAAPAKAPPSRTHGWVTVLSLKVSGRSAPYTREMMLAHWLDRQRTSRGS